MLELVERIVLGVEELAVTAEEVVVDTPVDRNSSACPVVRLGHDTSYARAGPGPGTWCANGSPASRPRGTIVGRSASHQVLAPASTVPPSCASDGPVRKAADTTTGRTHEGHSGGTIERP